MKSDKRRVAITGIGAVTPVGIGVNGFWDGILANRSGITELTRFDASQLRTRVAGEVNDFNPGDFLQIKSWSSGWIVSPHSR